MKLVKVCVLLSRSPLHEHFTLLARIVLKSPELKSEFLPFLSLPFFVQNSALKLCILFNYTSMTVKLSHETVQLTVLVIHLTNYLFFWLAEIVQWIFEISA